MCNTDTDDPAEPTEEPTAEPTEAAPDDAPCDDPVQDCPCQVYVLAEPRIIAVAIDGYLTPTHPVDDPNLPVPYTLNFGQDLEFGSGGDQPHGNSVSTSSSELETTMRGLLGEFAQGDSDGKAERLFDAFLTPQSEVTFWSDEDLTAAVNAHSNIDIFVHRALSAPTFSEEHRTEGATRIHQALEAAGWNIDAAIAPDDLGVPAVNLGDKANLLSGASEDFDNGLGVMINGFQYAIVIAKEYYYDRCAHEYYIKLEYVFYDVFGLDDDDLDEFGTTNNIFRKTAAHKGITAWWQLQHQHGYAPLITRISIEREFTVPTR